ncbi:unnamed protein product [Blepharisma stoltei]|uniref:BTB domain-containing protein n=1 Tax=Blepharisma stoltei TaxID=1481888 RepID=A0AAU9IYT8_9CILI|nr:unnamed protein product [Blepharisma stoltei]
MRSRRNSSEPSPDVIFEAGEDLYTNASLALTKGAIKRIPLARPRVAQSYCFEFCGIIGVAYRALRFVLDSKPLNEETYIIAPCIVKVFHSCDILQSAQNSLQPALLELFNSGLEADIKIETSENKIFSAHKCILMCRSPKFRAMFNSSMTECENSYIKLPDTDPCLFDRLLKWIYTGSTLMPEDINDLCSLLVMADEYMLNDLKMRCEEDIISKLCPENVVQIMEIAHKLPLVSDNLMSECKEVFVKEYNKVKECQPDMEKIIASVPGLMTEIFSHFHKSSNKHKARRVTFRIEDAGDPLEDVSTVYSGYSSTGSYA